MLVLRGDFEVRQQHCPDKDIVCTETHLHEITADVLPGCVTSELPRDEGRKGQSPTDPGKRLDQCFFFL